LPIGAAVERELKMVTGGKRPQVLIVGGGPAGLVLAIELGRRIVPCVLFEKDLSTPTFSQSECNHFALASENSRSCSIHVSGL
jgi:thioredoxin reductase